MIAHVVEGEEAYCWRCGTWLLDSQSGHSNGIGYGGDNSDGDGYGNGDGFGNGSGNGYSYGTGWAVGDGFGNGGGDGDGNGYGCGDHLPLCDDSLACACRQAQGPA